LIHQSILAGDSSAIGAHCRPETIGGNTPPYTGKQAVIVDRGPPFIRHSSAVAFLPACVTFSISINRICDF